MDKSPVGVDLEEVGPARLPVARRTFAAEEYTYLQSLAGRERDLFFTALWTAKESVLKWAGDGLAGGLAAVSVEHRHLRPATARYRQTRLRLAKSSAPGLAWCSQQPPPRIPPISG